MASGPRRIRRTGLFSGNRDPARSAAAAAGGSVARIPSHDGSDRGLFLTNHRSGADRSGSRMAKGAADHVPPSWSRAAALILMFKSAQQIRAAVSLLNPGSIRDRAEQRVTIGLVASTSSGYAEMEDFLIPATV